MTDRIDPIAFNEIEEARKIEYLRCDAIEQEFGANSKFVLDAICAGWSIERARQEYFGLARRYKNETTELLYS